MKTKLLLASLILFGIVITVASCKKEDNATLATVTTTELTNATDTSVTSGGNITSNGGSAIIERGVCWSNSENPTITDNKLVDQSGSNNFVSNITGLKGGQTYYIRAYATNSIGTQYGQSISLTTTVKSEKITLGTGYTNDVYYSLKNGVIAQVPRANWDIAFSVSTRSSSIIINEGSGVTLKVYPTSAGWNWADAIDTTGYHSWTSLWNSDTSWEVGAFNQNATGHPNYGWGVYDMNTHNINGVALYIIKLRNGSFRKIWIEEKFSALQQYSFRYANLDGSDEHIVSNIDISSCKANYMYYSLQDNAKVDREPNTSTWDILFTKWIDNSISYPVTGVLQNIGINAIDVTASDLTNITYTDSQFVSDINTIGSDWKSFNMATNAYTVATNRAFIVKDKAGRVYQIIFTGFVGSSTGEITFSIKQL